MNIIPYRKIFLSVSGILVVAGIAAIFIFGFRQGIDLAGGANWEIKFFNASAPEEKAVSAVFNDLLGDKSFSVRKSADDNNLLMRLPDISESDHQNYKKAFEEKFGSFEEVRFENIGSSIGADLRRKSIMAAALVLLGIALYVAWAFRKVSRPISSWKYGLIALLTLFHDVIIPAGIFAVLGNLKGIEIDTNFIVALLVIMGFSVHDTIVVFDRIRENLIVSRGSRKLADIINSSVKETFSRSVNTSLTLFLVLLALILWGPDSLFYFNLTILIGTVIGTYSSIFIASPSLLFFDRKRL
ncbi:MAG: protein translocase subunit SecF [Candidatus Brennerbacteria bacterium]|nr:protein translocase subunit SecF [Candidatus Brennerbacteria bacterium]